MADAPDQYKSLYVADDGDIEIRPYCGPSYTCQGPRGTQVFTVLILSGLTERARRRLFQALQRLIDERDRLLDKL